MNDRNPDMNQPVSKWDGTGHTGFGQSLRFSCELFWKKLQEKDVDVSILAAEEGQDVLTVHVMQCCAAEHVYLFFISACALNISFAWYCKG